MAMGKHAIEFKPDRKSPRQFWAWRAGSRKQARQSAEGLLVSLRECGATNARVFVDGRRVDKVTV